MYKKTFIISFLVTALNFTFTWYATSNWSLPDIEKLLISNSIVPVWWQFPLLILYALLGMWFLVNILPDKENIRQSNRVLAVSIVGIVVFFSVGHVGMMLLAAKSASVEIWVVIMITLTYVLLLTIGNYIATSRKSWLTGLPTPWTMESDLSWAKTHRFLGQSIIVVALVSLAGGLIGSFKIGFYILILGGIGVLLLATFYSWIVWKNDPAMKK